MIRRHQLPVFLIGSIILGSLSTTVQAGIRQSGPPMLLLIALPISLDPPIGLGDGVDRAAGHGRQSAGVMEGLASLPVVFHGRGGRAGDIG